MSIEFHLTHYERCRREGVAALKSGDRQRARSFFLRSAEYLYQVAQRSEGDLKDVRSRRAQELVSIAEGISSSSDARPTAQTLGTRSGESESSADPTRYQISERPDVRFDDVAGMEEVKEEIRLKIVYPFQHREAAQQYGITGGGGVLFYGPPGTGKTLLARAVAGETDCAFFTVRPSDILSKWVGEAEKNFAALFEAARNESPSIIFIDEIDSLAPRREHNQSSVMARLVPQILAELEGFAGQDAPVLFIGATNEPWSLDPAMLRPGRFDEAVYIGLPDVDARARILELELQDCPLAADVDLAALAAGLDRYSGADVRGLCRKAADDAFLLSIRTGDTVPIDSSILESVRKETAPSVSPDVLARFEQYAALRTSGV